MPTKTWRLRRVRQCAKCPWKQSVNPRDIPEGYCEAKHRGLARTIAPPGDPTWEGPAMACHESAPGREYPCVGWLVQQLGPGNNLGLRLWMLSCENADRLTTEGPQHARFEDTLPTPS